MSSVSLKEQQLQGISNAVDQKLPQDDWKCHGYRQAHRVEKLAAENLGQGSVDSQMPDSQYSKLQTVLPYILLQN